jgi:outer membrane lipoprotein-sorting protein
MRGTYGRAFCIIAAIGMLGGASPAAHGAGEDPRDLLKRVLDSAPKKPFVAKMRLATEGGLARELMLNHKHVGDAEASYMDVTAPLDVKDMRFLFFDRIEGRDEQYIYMPAIKRSIQVADEIRKQPFLGSEFYVSDLVTPELDSFTYVFAGDETVAGRACKLVEVTPKSAADQLYSKAILAIDPADLVIVRTQFFDPKGKPLKVWTIDKLERIDGVWTPLVQRMTNQQENRTSTLEISEVRYNVELPDNMFTRTNLNR